MNLNKVEPFLSSILDTLKNLRVEISSLDLDHIGYQASSSENYDDLKPQFEELGEMVKESIVGGRRVGIFKLTTPLIFEHYSIPAIELVEPKKGQSCPSDFEHIEFVLSESFDSFMNKYPDINWDTTAVTQPGFPMIKLKINDNTQVKFHLESVLTIVEKMNKNDRPITTLFMLVSVDGKISTGGVDDRDTDKDYKVITGVKEGLHQYYELEKQTDRFSLNTGKVMAKIGVNTDNNPIHCPEVTFVIIDGKHLNSEGVTNLCDNLKELILVTTNKQHPAFDINRDNLRIVYYKDEIDFADLFSKLKLELGVDRLTLQSGGTLNSVLLRRNLVDKLSIVLVPCLIGGHDTSTLVDGDSLISEEDLKFIKTMNLEKATVLENSYLHLQYLINN